MRTPGFAPVSEERRTRNTQWQARTSLAVNAASLDVLLREQDPLDVLSKWALIRGQVEPLIWGEIDAILEEIAIRAASPHEPNAPQDTYLKRQLAYRRWSFAHKERLALQLQKAWR